MRDQIVPYRVIRDNADVQEKVHEGVGMVEDDHKVRTKTGVRLMCCASWLGILASFETMRMHEKRQRRCWRGSTAVFTFGKEI